MKIIKSIDTDAYNFMRVVDPYDKVKNPYAIDNLVKNIKAIPGGWQPNRVFYPFYGGTADSCKFNLFNPALYQLSYTGVPTFNNTGMLGSDTSGAGTSSFIPADAGMSLYGSMYGVSRHTKAPSI